MKHEYKLMAVCILASVALGGILTFALLNLPKSSEQMYREFYAAEALVGVSPSDYIDDLKMGKNDSVLVDLRSSGEYRAGHLVTAVSIPAVEMDSKQLLAAFSKLPKNKPAIMYCYSEYCMLSRQAGNALAQNGIYAKHFTAGWYEIQRDFAQYIVNGTEAGSLAADGNYTANACGPGTGEFRC